MFRCKNVGSLAASAVKYQVAVQSPVAPLVRGFKSVKEAKQSEKIQEVANRLVELNILEINQFMKIVQVILLHVDYFNG
jgi:hypothetical protein